MTLPRSRLEVETIESTDAIVSVLEQDRCMTAYALADLDPPYRQNARFIGAFQDGAPIAVLLLYRLPSTTSLLPFGDVRGIEAILEQATELPDTTFLLAHDDYRPAIHARYDIHDSWPMDRMVLETSEIRPAPSTHRTVQRLTEVDIPAIRELYVDWDDTFFDELMLRSGVYCGVFDGPQLVAVSGTHVVSPRWKLACIGGVFTHPAYRGQGLATATTGAVVHVLADLGIGLIALNVKDDNEPAINAYRRLGFRKHDSYFEGHATLQ